MTHDQLYEACESLSGITIGDFTVYWDYPGFLNLNRAATTAPLPATWLNNIYPSSHGCLG